MKKYIATLKEKASLLKKEVMVIYYALLNNRTPFLAKIFAAITVGYLLSPIDLIPDFIPVLGLLDDLLLVPLLIKISVSLIPKSILEEIRLKVNANEKLHKKWYFAVPVICIYFLVLMWLYLKFYSNFQ